MGSISRMSGARLAELVRAGDVPQRVAVVDVRDSDFAGGHIRGARNIPAGELYDCLDELVAETARKDAVVFHCMLSKMRGPSAAQLFARRVKRATAAQRERRGGGGGGGGVDDAVAERVEEQTPAKSAPQVYVLDGGFAAFVRDFGDEPELFSDLQPSLWR